MPHSASSANSYLASSLRLNPDDAVYSKLVNYVLGRGPK